MAKPDSHMLTLSLAGMSSVYHQFVAGSEEAFNHYYQRYHGSVYLALMKLCGDGSVAQDLTQEVFRKIWDRRARFNDEEHLCHYIFRMTRCVFLMHKRRERQTLAAENEVRSRTERADEPVDAVFVREQVFANIRDSLMKLPPQQKVVMELLMYRGLDVKAVAQRLQLAPQTVRNHKTQALNFLRNDLAGRDLSIGKNSSELPG